MMPRRNWPASGSLFCLANSLIAAVCSSTRSACATICAPIGVIDISLPPRSKITTPSSSSSFLIATDKVGCATKQASAAWPKCFSRATATIYLSSVKVMGVSSHSRKNKSRWAATAWRRLLYLQEIFARSQPARQMRFHGGGVVVQHGLRRVARLFAQPLVGLQVGAAQHGFAGLARAEEFAGAANIQIAARDLEAIRSFAHGSQALLGDRAERV